MPTVEHHVRTRSGFDVSTLVQRVVAQYPQVEVLALVERGRVLGLRRVTRLSLRGPGDELEQVWDQIQAGLPDEDGTEPRGESPWTSWMDD